MPLPFYLSRCAILALHVDRSRLDLLGNGAIERARSQFNAAVLIAKLPEFLRDVMDHSARQPARRETGRPREEPAIYSPPRKGYQRLPAGLRAWLRNRVCARPRLSYWLLRR